MQSLNYTGGSTVFKTTYGYSQNGGNNGEITNITDLNTSGRSITYTYDALNRLSTAGITGSSNYPKWGLSFTYDRYGNRTAQTVTAGTAPSSSVVVSSATNHITTAGYAYDLNGNMTNDAVNSLGYDGENRLISSSGSAGSGTYSYRASGLRVVKVSAGTTTVYLFDGHNDIAEYVNGVLANEYIYAGKRQLASYLSGTLYYQGWDHQSSRVMLNTSGTLAGQKGQYPFGEDWYTTTLTNRHFTSYERDTESSNDNALHRFYVNRLGRFSANDPLPHGGQNPQGFNLYNYTYNDPVNRRDPTGMDTTRDCWFLGCPPDVGGGDDGDDGDGGGGGGGTSGIGSCNPDSVEGNSCPPPEPPPPPPDPSCKDELKIRRVKFTFGLANHAFWYYKNMNGGEGTLSAGPNKDRLRTILGLAFLNSFPASPPGTGEFKSDTVSQPTVFYGQSQVGANVCFSVEVMVDAASSYQDNVVPYNAFFGPNSNSFAHTLGDEFGFFDVPQPPRTPGWNVIVPF